MSEAAVGEPIRGIRLRPHEIAAVREILLDAFGPDAELYVYGSRARSDLRGGDLDLFVRVPGRAAESSDAFGVAERVEDALGGRHTDLLVLGAEDQMKRIHRRATETGVPF